MLDLLLLGQLIIFLCKDESAMHLLIPYMYDMVGTKNRYFELTAEVLAFAVRIYAHVAAACAREGSTSGFNNAVDMLLKLHKYPQSDFSAALLHGSQASVLSTQRIVGRCPGALATAMGLLSDLLTSAPVKYSSDWNSRVLSLYSDFALMLPNESYAEDLGCLLPAIAVGMESDHFSLDHGGSSDKPATSDLSLDALVAMQDKNRERGARIRSLWLTSSFWDFADILGEEYKIIRCPKWPREWGQALALIAQFSESFILGLQQQSMELYLEVLSADYETFSSDLKDKIDDRSLMQALSSIVVDLPKEATTAMSRPMAAHLLAIGYMGVVHAHHYLYTFEKSRRSFCPLLGIFEILRTTLPTSSEYPWLIGILNRIYATIVDRLSNANTSFSHDGNSVAFLGATDILRVLTEALIVKTNTRDLSRHAAALLDQFLTSFPALLFSVTTFEIAVWAVADQELVKAGGGFDEEPGTNHVGESSLSLRHLLRIVEMAANHAPSICEAVLMEQMRHLAEQSGRHATIGAQFFPRIMQSLQSGRKQCRLPDVSGPFKGLVGWTTKVRALGTVKGLVEAMQGSDESLTTTIAAVSRHCARSIADALEETAPDSFLSNLGAEAAAVVVLYSQRVLSTGRNNLLRLLAWLPLSRFDLHVTQCSVSLWHWILASSDESARVFLVEEICNAWIATQTQQLGVFSRAIEAVDTAERNTSKLLEEIRAHHCWIIFFVEFFNILDRCAPFRYRDRLSRSLRRVLAASLDKDGRRMTNHAAALVARCRVSELAISFASRDGDCEKTEARVAMNRKLMRSAVTSLLLWFERPVRWLESSKSEMLQSIRSVRDAFEALEELPKDLFSSSEGRARTLRDAGVNDTDSRQETLEVLTLTKALLQEEEERLVVWARPLDVHKKRAPLQIELSPSSTSWGSLVRCAWKVSPRLAISLAEHYPSNAKIRREVTSLVCQHAEDATIQKISDAARFLASPTSVQSDISELRHLSTWSIASLEQSLSLISGIAGRHPDVRAYAIRSIAVADPDDTAFFLPQLVQFLRYDPDRSFEKLLISIASRSSYFAYLLVCQLSSEGTPPEEAFSPPVKRSNWTPPQDTGLWQVADEVRGRLWETLHGPIREHLDAEVKFFDEVTAVSGKLYPVPKEERKEAAIRFLSDVRLPRDDLFMPTDPHTCIKSILSESATPMQSAAKCPFLAAFDVERWSPSDRRTQSVTEAAIFKVGDDCRQDVLALQVLKLLKSEFDAASLPLKLMPYSVVPTGHECGVIQVVPNAKSRAQLGELTDGGLYEIFQREFGLPGSPRFETARTAFIESSAAYAVASYLLQAKDRHNGNIMVDNKGNIVHIDFGYILGISPGGNMGFESAAFKLSYEMTQLLDPGNTRASREFLHFQELCVKGYLVSRTAADSLIATVAMMEKSGLPCFGYRSPVVNLRERFHLEMTHAEAATWMKQLISDAYDKWTTGVYDLIQYYQNAIPK